MTRTVRAVYHGHYNVRDQRGHYVKPKTARGHVCHHSCCNGTRVHPEHLPVKISKSYLRTLSEPQLERELNAYSNYSETHEEGFLQVLAELDRREQVEKNRQARYYRARDKRWARTNEWHDEVYRQWLMAEAETNGYMLNKAGKAKDIDEKKLFVGPESYVRAYASRELLDFFQTHPRPTRAAFMGSYAQRRAAGAGRGWGSA